MHGALALNGTTTITNGDNLNPATGLLVENDATITGTGPLVLQAQTGNAQPNFIYDSSSGTEPQSGPQPSVYSGPISGPGGVVIGETTGTLQLASSLNAYTGETYIEGPYAPSNGGGASRLARTGQGPDNRAPATLGVGDLVMDTIAGLTSTAVISRCRRWTTTHTLTIHIHPGAAAIPARILPTTAPARE